MVSGYLSCCRFSDLPCVTVHLPVVLCLCEYLRICSTYPMFQISFSFLKQSHLLVTLQVYRNFQQARSMMLDSGKRKRGGTLANITISCSIWTHCTPCWAVQSNANTLHSCSCRQRKAALGGRGAECSNPGNENHVTSRAVNGAAESKVAIPDYCLNSQLIDYYTKNQIISLFC